MPPSPEEICKLLQILDGALRRVRDRYEMESLSSEGAERIFVLSFAMLKLARNFDEIAGMFSGSEPEMRLTTRST